MNDGAAWKVIQKQQHGAVRMKEGLSAMLSLHSANELSSICGNINLQILQKASTSKRLILEYLNGNENIVTRDRAEKLLRTMWEQPILEYLRSIGHSISPISIDPRESVLTMWVEGGFVKNEPLGK